MVSVISLNETLDEIKQIAHQFQDEWWIIGSAAAWLAGAKLQIIDDVDLLVSERDHAFIKTQWAKKLLNLQLESQKFHSEHFARFQFALVVEVMAGFSIHTADGWKRVEPKTRIGVDGVFIPEIKEQIDFLKMMDRPKDHRRIRFLQEISKAE